jgi:plasmid stabilization system protein ParE
MVAAQSHKSSQPLSRRAPTSVALIAEYPEAGVVAEDVELADVRRVVLVDTQHYVYYRADRDAKRIEVLAVWSARFGEPPPISGS